LCTHLGTQFVVKLAWNMTIQEVDMAARKRRAGRNRNGTGNVRQLRENLWQGSVQLAPQDRRYVSGRTKEEAEQKLSELIYRHQQHMLPAKGHLTVGEYLESWLRDHVEGKRAPSTVDNYRLNVQRLQPLHRFELTKLEP